MKGGIISNAFGRWLPAGYSRRPPVVSRWIAAAAFACLSLLSAGVPAAWTPVAQGVETFELAGRPTLLALPGAGSSAPAAATAPRVLVVADESPEGLRFVDPDSATELGTLALPARVVALAMDANGVNAYVLTSNDRLHVVAIATRSLVATFNLGGNPRALLLRENAGQVVEVLVGAEGPRPGDRREPGDRRDAAAGGARQRSRHARLGHGRHARAGRRAQRQALHAGALPISRSSRPRRSATRSAISSGGSRAALRWRCTSVPTA